MLEFFATAGGLFAVLAFIHFFADWIFQTHREATNKHNNPFIRGRHCLVYTAAFVPFMLLIGISGWSLLVSIATLFLSHFIIDTYVPVFLWARYMRRVPALIKSTDKQTTFKQLWEQPVYPILFITIDQICHLTFLWPIVLIALL